MPWGTVTLPGQLLSLQMPQQLARHSNAGAAPRWNAPTLAPHKRNSLAARRENRLCWLPLPGPSFPASEVMEPSA